MRHFPGFVDVDEKSRLMEYPFDKFSEVLELEWVAYFHKMKGFKRFSVAGKTIPPDAQEYHRKIGLKHRPTLMAEYEDSFWAIGYLDNLEGIEELPDWVRPEV